MCNLVPHHAAALPSDHRFGSVFAGVCLLLAGWGRIKGWSGIAQASFGGLSAFFLLAAFAAPTLLAPLNRAWFALGQLLHKIVSPVVLGAMFFLLITPVAIVARLLGRDALRLTKHRGSTYWIDRTADVVASESFKNQF